MKRNFTLIAFFFLAFTSYGQSLEFTDKVLDKLVLDVNLDGCGMVTKEMQQELQLTEEQFRTVELVNKQHFQQLLKAEEAYAGDLVQLKQSYTEINTKSIKSLSTVLSEEQLSQYIKMAAAKKEKFYFSANQHE